MVTYIISKYCLRKYFMFACAQKFHSIQLIENCDIEK